MRPLPVLCRRPALHCGAPLTIDTASPTVVAERNRDRDSRKAKRKQKQKPRSSHTLHLKKTKKARSCCAANTLSVGVCGIEPRFFSLGAHAIIVDIFFFSRDPTAEARSPPAG